MHRVVARAMHRVVARVMHRVVARAMHRVVAWDCVLVLCIGSNLCQLNCHPLEVVINNEKQLSSYTLNISMFCLWPWCFHFPSNCQLTYSLAGQACVYIHLQEDMLSAVAAVLILVNSHRSC